jgi:hypothetical protein
MKIKGISEDINKIILALNRTTLEAPGVRGVDYAFPEGDNAMPGEYTRVSFKEYMIAGR